MTDKSFGRVPSSTRLAGEIVAAYITNNAVPVAELLSLLHSVHKAVTTLVAGIVPGAVASANEVEKPTPAQIRRSVQPEGLVSFIDGKTYKTLKRHLTRHGLHPQSYSERYGLPVEYPMVAPNYAAQRSALAKAFGLGQPGAMAVDGRKGRRRVP